MMVRKKQKRVSKNDWLVAAIDMLESNGIEGVNIERLARNLGIAKSGFYWHFKDKKELYKQLLDYWIHEFTEVVIGNFQHSDDDAKKKLNNVMEMIEQFDLAKYDLAIVNWAKNDPLAQAAVENVYKMRLDYIRSIFAEFGFEADETEMRTRLFVCYHSWENTMYKDLDPEKRVQLRKRRLAFFTRK
ncbi:MAG: TetR/AcrR family transcriptional regulator [Methylococcales bacterium]|nr:TetR/AcrR family transcriptional regulator [Methylococcales bacterium]